ncbi:hypothetical protein K8T06_08910 [bacterium]|nr:hypothetical protein [bacterium]
MNNLDVNRYLCLLALLVVITAIVPVLADDLVLEQDQLKRFIGRIDADEAALDGKAIFLDPLLGQTPKTSIPAGKYTAYIHARSTMAIASEQQVCQLIVLSINPPEILLNRDILCREIQTDGVYRTIAIPFETSVPATISLLLEMRLMGHNDIFLDSMGIAGQNIMKRWSWTEMTHHLGTAIDDAEAVSGQAWTNAHAMAYGPYISLPDGPGRYEALFRLAIDSCLKATNIGTLDVFAHDGKIGNGSIRGNKTYAIRGLDSNDFPGFGQYMEFCLPFLYDGAKKMEFRVLLYYIHRNAVRLDRITIKKVADTKHKEPVPR